MEIIRLKEVVKIATGNIKSSTNFINSNGNYEYYDRSNFSKLGDIGKYNIQSVIMPSEGNLSFQLTKGYYSHHQKTYRIYSSSSKLITKYLFFWFKSNIKMIYAKGNGSTVRRYNINNMDLYISLPNKQKQQEIIDIIESLEKKVNMSTKMLTAVLETALHDEKKLKYNLEIIDIIESLEKKVKIAIENNNFIITLTNLFFWDKKSEDNLKKYIDKVKNGYSFKSKLSGSGQTKFMTISYIKDKKTKISSEIPELKFKSNIGDTITGLSGTIGTSNIITKDNLYINQRLLALESKYGIFIMSAINKFKGNLLQKATGAAQKNIKVNDILQIKVPTLNENDKKMFIEFTNSYINNEKIVEENNNLINLLLKKLIK